MECAGASHLGTVSHQIIPGVERIPPSFRPLVQLHSIRYISYLTPHIEHTKTTWVTETFCFQHCKKTKQTCRNACTWSSGECNWWSVSHHEPLDITPPPLGRLANKKIFWSILCYMSLLTAGSRCTGSNEREVSSVTSPSSSILCQHLSSPKVCVQ